MFYFSVMKKETCDGNKREPKPCNFGTVSWNTRKFRGGKKFIFTATISHFLSKIENSRFNGKNKAKSTILVENRDMEK